MRPTGGRAGHVAAVDLTGHCRSPHVGALRRDGVAPSILGMNQIIGDDSLHRAFSAIAPAPDNKHTGN